MSSAIDPKRMERCQRRVDEHPESATARFNLGLAYTERGRMDRAEEAYGETLKLNPDLVEAWVNLGGVRMLKWDYEGSIKANRAALEHNPEAVLAHYNIGQASLYLGDVPGVIEANRRVIELEPNHAAAHYYLGVGLLASGHVEAARVAVAHAKDLGHSPTPELLRALENAHLTNEPHDGTLVKHIGATAPENTNRR